MCDGMCSMWPAPGTMTRRVPELNRAVPNALCYMHPDDAKDRSVRRGDEITVAGCRFEVTLPLVT